MIDLIRLHGTKLLGFLGITLGVLATADPALVGGTGAIKYYLLGISLLNVWRGFFTSDAFKIGLVVKEENAAKAASIMKSQSGFVHAALLANIVLGLAIVFAGVSLHGCVDTRAAYKAAPLHGQAVSDTAYVVAEHYSAVVKEAADLRESGRVPAAIVQAMQEADRRARPLIIGIPDNATTRPVLGLRQLAEKYTALHDAQTEAELQAAVNNAVLALGDLMRAVNSAKGK